MKQTPAQRARAKYEKERRGKVVFRVQLALSDNEAEWLQLKNALVKKYGSAKQGVYMLAKKDKLI